MTATAQPLAAPPTVEDNLFEARRILDAYTDRMQCADALDAMRTAAQDTYDGFTPHAVAYLALEGGNGDEYGNGEYWATGYDADGREIENCGFTVPGPAFSTGAVPEVFQPDHTQPGPGHGAPVNACMVIDVAKVKEHDYETDALATQEAVVFAQLNRMWARGDVEYYAVTRAYLADVVREEAQGYQVALSPDEVATAAAAVMGDARLEEAFTPVRDEVFRLAAEQVEKVAQVRDNS